MDYFDRLFLVSGEASGGVISPVGSIGVSSNKTKVLRGSCKNSGFIEIRRSRSSLGLSAGCFACGFLRISKVGLFGEKDLLREALVLLLNLANHTPLEYLEPVLREDIQKLRDEVAKPEAHKKTALSEVAIVSFPPFLLTFLSMLRGEVAALPSYEEKEEQFKEQVDQLRRRISDSFSTGFSFSLWQAGKTVKENKDMDLPAHKVMKPPMLLNRASNSTTISIKAELCAQGLPKVLRDYSLDFYSVNLGSEQRERFQENPRGNVKDYEDQLFSKSQVDE
ncbi:hypothetical protein H0E87_025510 [Populus deltoides]|uniref:Uncharacterized protein n=1 Tax=Populus deltoides TaxID=3696 RepID=A0A8T2X063_POPDE|nr:hypothetical protein H0E87_025510 [Populus deltoides]